MRAGRKRAMNEQILQEISEFCRPRGLAESTFGRRAVNDGKLASRLRNGGRITTDTLDRIRGFMARSAGRRAGAPPRAVRARSARRSARRESTPCRRWPQGCQRRSAAQFPFLRQPAEISAVREHLLGEVGSRERASASSSPTSIRGRRRCACSTPASVMARCSRA